MANKGTAQKANTKSGMAILDGLMNERVAMLGMPQVIVTRAFCYGWLKEQGWNEGRPNSQQSGYCFQSFDYAAFGRAATDQPLTEPSERDNLLSLLAKALKRDMN